MLPDYVRVIAVGYLLLGLYGVAWATLNRVWRSLSDTEALVVAGMLVAPLALGLVWPRLAGVKAFGIELSLAQVTVAIESNLAPAVMTAATGSAPPELIDHIRGLIQSRCEVIEVNLRDGSYWWSTRLYLLARLASDLTESKIMVFVDRDQERRFVGMATPEHVYEALSNRRPELEQIYEELPKRTAGVSDYGHAANLVNGWTGNRFWNDTNEKSFAERVSPAGLRGALHVAGYKLAGRTVEWPGSTSDQIFRSIARNEGQYVALSRFGVLDCVIDRQELAIATWRRVK